MTMTATFSPFAANALQVLADCGLASRGMGLQAAAHTYWQKPGAILGCIRSPDQSEWQAIQALHARLIAGEVRPPEGVAKAFQDLAGRITSKGGRLEDVTDEKDFYFCRVAGAILDGATLVFSQRGPSPVEMREMMPWIQTRIDRRGVHLLPEGVFVRRARQEVLAPEASRILETGSAEGPGRPEPRLFYLMADGGLYVEERPEGDLFLIGTWIS
ncbi:MAG TPA: hypothetical protein VLJ37_04765 [bacterium]|nr:hypothetical protein [bacterium]